MNKSGNVFLGLALAVFIFVMGVLVLPYLTDDITTFRVALGCANTGSISGGTMITCLYAGALAPYFIWFFISLAVGLVLGGING